MKDLVPMSQEFLRRAAKVSGLKIVFGTDACQACMGATRKNSFITYAIAEWTQQRR